MMTEKWKDVEGYEGLYSISDLGNVRNVRTKRVLKKGTNKHGYWKVVFSVNGKTKTQLVHRLVAKAFVANPDNKPQINHINGDKSDNRKDNLEWVTQSENNLHARRILKRNPGGVQRKNVLCIETGVVYSSTAEAARAVNGKTSGISKVCNGKGNTHRKLHWQFI